jgi:hypothetical protein
VFLTPATPLNSSQIFQLLKTDVERQSALLFHGINPTAWMYNSGRFLSDARSLSQQNWHENLSTGLQFGFLWNFYTLSASCLHMYSSTIILFCSFTSSVVGIMNGKGVRQAQVWFLSGWRFSFPSKCYNWPWFPGSFLGSKVAGAWSWPLTSI